MAKLSDITTAPLSHLNHIDALLSKGPAWNYQTGNPANTIYYSFSLAGYTLPDNEDVPGAVQAFSATQQQATRFAISYLSAVTGIDFVESSGADAQVHFVNGDVLGAGVTAECLWQAAYETDGWGRVVAYEPEAVIYLDNAQYGAENGDLTPGGAGYETLLHELGHMLGLKHPFEGSVTLPDATDNTYYTLMSYSYGGGPYASYGEYDLAALKWLYGGDGLAGGWGVNSVDGGVWLTGTSGNDVLTGTPGGDLLESGSGNDMVFGSLGLDAAIFAGDRSDYVVTAAPNGFRIFSDGLATDTRLFGVERLLFDDAVVALDIDGNGGAAYRLYQAAFDRAPDEVGLGYWIDALDSGVSLHDAAVGFITSDEFIALYHGIPDNATFVDGLYRNILHRAPEQGGYDYWVGVLAEGRDRADVLVGFSESAENKDALAAVIGNGFEYTPFG